MKPILRLALIAATIGALIYPMTIQYYTDNWTTVENSFLWRIPTGSHIYLTGTLFQLLSTALPFVAILAFWDRIKASAVRHRTILTVMGITLASVGLIVGCMFVITEIQNHRPKPSRSIYLEP